MTTAQLASWAIAFGKRVITEVLYWFQQIMTATGLMPLWAGTLVVTAVFSIILIPLRGGADLTRGALGQFVFGRINKAKRTDHQD